MDKLKMSPAEELKKVEIKTIEQECLNRVFDYLTSQCDASQKVPGTEDKIGPNEIAKTLLFLGCRPTRAEVELIIWVSFGCF